MAHNASAEDYLETILLLSKKAGSVRSKDVVGETGYSKPSISVAMRKLRENGMITMDDEGVIKLTEKGQTAAAAVYDRHSTLFNWLLSIGVGEENAARDACQLEHILSEESFLAIKRLGTIKIYD